MSHVAVVGAGFAGLAAAAALAARGHAVTLLESQGHVGGEARRLEAGGARVDVGPTVLTDLGPLSELFQRLGVPLADAVPLVRLDPGLVATFPGGVRLALHREPSRLAAELRALGPHAASDWARLQDLGARASRLADHFYARGDVSDVRDLMGFLLRGGVSPGDLAPFARHGSLARLLSATVRTPELYRLLAHFARFVGLDAEHAPAVTIVIPYLVASAGIVYPRGGISALAEAIATLATKHGASLELGQPVQGLDVGRGRVKAVRTADGRRVAVDACVAAVDAHVTADWLPGGLDRRVSRLRPALAGRVAWWVVEGPPRLGAHHALHFGPDRDVDPLYVATPTVTDPGLATTGQTVVYALRHGPPGEAASAALGESLRVEVAAAGQWPGGAVGARGVSGGTRSCYGYAIGPGLFASFRPPQRVASVENLVLAGGSVFPGPGVANAVRSGLRAATLAEASLAGADP